MIFNKCATIQDTEFYPRQRNAEFSFDFVPFKIVCVKYVDSDPDQNTLFIMS